jgi:hypothetical protein
MVGSRDNWIKLQRLQQKVFLPFAEMEHEAALV